MCDQITRQSDSLFSRMLKLKKKKENKVYMNTYMNTYNTYLESVYIKLSLNNT